MFLGSQLAVQLKVSKRKFSNTWQSAKNKKAPTSFCSQSSESWSEIRQKEGSQKGEVIQLRSKLPFHQSFGKEIK
jgi:hypothetical protein